MAAHGECDGTGAKSTGRTKNARHDEHHCTIVGQNPAERDKMVNKSGQTLGPCHPAVLTIEVGNAANVWKILRHHGDCPAYSGTVRMKFLARLLLLLIRQHSSPRTLRAGRIQ